MDSVQIPNEIVFKKLLIYEDIKVGILGRI